MSLLAAKTANTAPPEHIRREEQREILAGLRSPQKRISSKYFYDERGSALFDQICRLPEYYPTRTEAGIMAAHLPEIAEHVGPGASVIEFGAGSNDKARRLLAGLDNPVSYVPVEISGEYVAEQAAELAADFPELSIKPVVADFTKPFELPEHPVRPQRNLIFFPGSTIGNFTEPDARRLLEVMRLEAGEDGALLIGVDLVKRLDIVLAAYNDSRGVTAAFNRNALAHINAGIGSDFRPELFRHEAIYDQRHQRIEMRLVSLEKHRVSLAGEVIEFERGEHIVTEYSHKYTIEGFTALARASGWSREAVWTDQDTLFSVHYLVPLQSMLPTSSTG